MFHREATGVISLECVLVASMLSYRITDNVIILRQSGDILFIYTLPPFKSPLPITHYPFPLPSLSPHIHVSCHAITTVCVVPPGPFVGCSSVSYWEANQKSWGRKASTAAAAAEASANIIDRRLRKLSEPNMPHIHMDVGQNARCR